MALLLDDLHWAERPTLLLLRHLIARGGAARLLIVGTYRESELARDHPLAATLAELRRDGEGERIRLGGLDASATAALVAREAGGAATPELAAAVYDETRGNAFFVEEVARHLAESGAAGGIPESVREVVGRRLTRLSPEANRLLGLAAVAGPTFDARLLESAGDVTGDELLDALDEALAAALIREEAGAPGTYAFEHALVREALYAEQGTLRRLRMHRRLADALAVADPGDARLEERAHHALEAAAAGGEVEAAHIAYRAARAALEGLAYESAAALLERAVLALADAPEPELRAELLLALGEARVRSGDARGARDALGESAAAAETCGRADLLARAALAYCGIGVYVGAADAGAVDLLERALAGADDPLRARLLARLAVQHYYDAPARCDSLSAEALALAREGDDPDAVLDALSARHAARWRPDGLDERLALCDEMLAAADAHGRLEAKLQARNWRVVDELESGDMAAARREMHAHAELAEQLRLPAFLWYAPLWAGVLAALEGRRDEAEALITEAQGLGERAQDPNAGMFGFIARWNVQIVYQHGDMLAFRTEAEAHRDASGTAIAWDIGFAYYHAVTGETETARADLALIAADGLDALPRDANWFASLWELGEAVRVLADAERAAELYALLLPYRDRTVVVARGAAVLGSLELLLSRLAMTMGRGDEAVAHGESGLAACERDGALGSRPRLASRWAPLWPRAARAVTPSGPRRCRPRRGCGGAARHRASGLADPGTTRHDCREGHLLGLPRHDRRRDRALLVYRRRGAMMRRRCARTAVARLRPALPARPGGPVADRLARGHAGCADHGQQAMSYGRFLLSSEFGRAVLENWQSEYLQFALFILLTIWFVQRGSPESKELGEAGGERRRAAGRRARRARTPGVGARARLAPRVYSHSLLLVMGAIFAATWIGQSSTGWTRDNAERRARASRAQLARLRPLGGVLGADAAELAVRVPRRRLVRDPRGLPARARLVRVEARRRAARRHRRRAADRRR